MALLTPASKKKHSRISPCSTNTQGNINNNNDNSNSNNSSNSNYTNSNNHGVDKDILVTPREHDVVAGEGDTSASSTSTVSTSTFRIPTSRLLLNFPMVKQPSSTSNEVRRIEPSNDDYLFMTNDDDHGGTNSRSSTTTTTTAIGTTTTAVASVPPLTPPPPSSLSAASHYPLDVEEAEDELDKKVEEEEQRTITLSQSNGSTNSLDSSIVLVTASDVSSPTTILASTTAGTTAVPKTDSSTLTRVGVIPVPVGTTDNTCVSAITTDVVDDGDIERGLVPCKSWDGDVIHKGVDTTYSATPPPCVAGDGSKDGGDAWDPTIGIITKFSDSHSTKFSAMHPEDTKESSWSSSDNAPAMPTLKTFTPKLRESQDCNDSDHDDDDDAFVHVTHPIDLGVSGRRTSALPEPRIPVQDHQDGAVVTSAKQVDSPGSDQMVLTPQDHDDDKRQDEAEEVTTEAASSVPSEHASPDFVTTTRGAAPSILRHPNPLLTFMASRRQHHNHPHPRASPSTGRRVRGLWDSTNVTMMGTILIHNNPSSPEQVPDDSDCSTIVSPPVSIRSNNDSVFEHLREETLVHVLSYLPLADLLRSGMVCRRWRHHVRATSLSSTGGSTSPLWRRVDASTFCQEAYRHFVQKHKRGMQHQQRRPLSESSSSVGTNGNSPTTPSSSKSLQHQRSDVPKRVKKEKSSEQWAREETANVLQQVLAGRRPEALIIANIGNVLCASHFDLHSSLLSSLKELTLTHFDTLTDTHLHFLLLMTLGGAAGASAANNNHHQNSPVMKATTVSGGGSSSTITSSTSSGTKNYQSKAPVRLDNKMQKPKSYNTLRTLRLEYCSLLTNDCLVWIAKTCHKHLLHLSLRGNSMITQIVELQDMLVTKLRRVFWQDEKVITPCQRTIQNPTPSLANSQRFETNGGTSSVLSTERSQTQAPTKASGIFGGFFQRPVPPTTENQQSSTSSTSSTTAMASSSVAVLSVTSLFALPPPVQQSTPPFPIIVTENDNDKCKEGVPSTFAATKSPKLGSLFLPPHTATSMSCKKEIPSLGSMSLETTAANVATLFPQCPGQTSTSSENSLSTVNSASLNDHHPPPPSSSLSSSSSSDRAQGSLCVAQNNKSTMTMVSLHVPAETKRSTLWSSSIYDGSNSGPSVTSLFTPPSTNQKTNDLQNSVCKERMKSLFEPPPPPTMNTATVTGHEKSKNCDTGMSILFSPPLKAEPAGNTAEAVADGLPALPKSTVPKAILVRGSSLDHLFAPPGTSPPRMSPRLMNHKRSQSHGSNSSTNDGQVRGSGHGPHDGGGNDGGSFSETNGSLERLDLRETAIRPSDLVDCLWDITHSHPLDHLTADQDGRDEDNCHSQVCVKALYLSPLPSLLAGEGTNGAPDVASSSPSSFAWTRGDLKRLELVLEMNHVEELHLGRKGLTIISNSQRQSLELEGLNEWQRLEDLVSIL